MPEPNVRPRDVTAWLENAVADAERRGLPELGPLLETLAEATTALRAADFNEDARCGTRSQSHDWHRR